ncbi:MAG: sulfatase [Saprospiraceae bacterium]|nr:sulfatase [Saprospiraceae bacterium]
MVYDILRSQGISLVFFSLLLLCIVSSCMESAPSSSSTAPPNIVFILADDLGWADLPSYGNTFHETPNLDRLRKEGMLFSNAYAAAPVCSPTRASIQAGQYPARMGINDFITGHWRPYEQMTVPINRTQYLPDSLITVGEAMKMAGYATAYFGKWHLGWSSPYQPVDQGYDDWRVHRRGTFYQLKSREAIFPPDENLDDETRLSEALTNYGLSFIEQHKDQPFFLFLSHYDVHVQLDADRDLIDKYLSKEPKDSFPGNAIYAAMIEHVDRSVGRIMDKLDTLGLAENTMVVFFSDNGGLVSRFDKIPLLAKDKLEIYEDSPLQYIATSNAPLRAEKGTVFEGGIREPLLIKWPAVVEAGSTSDQLISSVDFYPTFVDLAGGELPAEQAIDGESFVETLSDNAANPNRVLFWHYPVYHHGRPAGAVRQGKWKLVEHFDTGEVELYDLEEDIGEQNDLAAQFPQKKEELSKQLSDWRAGIDAQMPVPNPDFDPTRREEWGKHPSRQ